MVKCRCADLRILKLVKCGFLRMKSVDVTGKMRRCGFFAILLLLLTFTHIFTSNFQRLLVDIVNTTKPFNI